MTAPGIRDQEIQRLLADLITHQRTTSMILALLRKAVLTGKIAVVCNMQTKCFHNSRARFVIKNRLLVDILCKQSPGFLQLPALIERFQKLRLRITVL